jgi:hypothetical protein
VEFIVVLSAILLSFAFAFFAYAFVNEYHFIESCEFKLSNLTFIFHLDSN